MAKNVIRINEQQLKKIIAECVKKTLNESFEQIHTKKYAFYIWKIYGEIQQQIMNEDYSVIADKQGVQILGNIDGKEWTVYFEYNPYDNHRPNISSENATPYYDGKEIWLSQIFNEFSDEAYEIMEKKYGFHFEKMINLFGGGGNFPEKVIEEIDCVAEDDEIEW